MIPALDEDRHVSLPGIGIGGAGDAQIASLFGTNALRLAGVAMIAEDDAPVKLRSTLEKVAETDHDDREINAGRTGL